MNLQFWGLIAYVALFFFKPYEMYPFLIPLRLALVVPIITLVLVFVFGKFKIPKTSESILLILFFFFSLISSIISPFYNESNISIADLFKPITLFFLIVMVLDDERSIKRFIWIILIFTVFDNVGSFLAFKQGLFGNRYRFASYYGGIGGDANEYGLHMIMLLSLPILLIVYESSLAKKIFLIFSFFSYAYCFTRTLSRGSMVACAAVLLQIFIIQRKNLKYMVFMIALIAFLLYKTPESFWGRMDTITAKKDYADHAVRERFMAWEDGMKMIKRNPFLGVGLGAFPYAREKIAGRLEERDAKFIAHNTYIEIAAETGFINLFVFILIAFIVVKGSRNSEKFFEKSKHFYLKSLTQGLRIGFIAFLVSGVFMSQQYYRFFYIFVGVLTSIKILKEEMVDRDDKKFVESKH